MKMLFFASFYIMFLHLNNFVQKTFQFLPKYISTDIHYEGLTKPSELHGNFLFSWNLQDLERLSQR